MAENAFAPTDWGCMPEARRCAYLSHLLGVREKLEGLLHTSPEGAGLTSVLAEVEAALVLLGAGPLGEERNEG